MNLKVDWRQIAETTTRDTYNKFILNLKDVNVLFMDFFRWQWPQSNCYDHVRVMMVFLQELLCMLYLLRWNIGECFFKDLVLIGLLFIACRGVGIGWFVSIWCCICNWWFSSMWGVWKISLWYRTICNVASYFCIACALVICCHFEF